MTAVYYFITICFYGIHYPAAWFYVSRSLAGLKPEVQAEIRGVLRTRMRLLLGVWLVSICFAAGAIAWSSGSREIVAHAGQIAIFVFHVIWWPFVVPIFRLMEHELQSRGIERNHRATGSTRTASLKPRTAQDYLPAWMQPVSVLVGVAGVGGLIWQLVVHPPEQIRTMLLAGTFALSGLFLLIAWGWWIRRELSVSYVADGPAETAPNQIEAIEALRTFRVRGLGLLQIIGTATFFGFAMAVIETEYGTLSERTLGIYGGIVGTLVGVAGGVFGTIASIRMHHAMRRHDYGS